MLVYQGQFFASFGQFYLRVEGSELDDDPQHFSSQVNGLVGTAAKADVMFRVGIHTGHFDIRIAMEQSEPPIESKWEEIAEASWELPEARAVGLCDVDSYRFVQVDIPPGSYRLRFSAVNFGTADRREKPVAVIDQSMEQYELVLWPAPWAPDAILKVTSEAAQYCHDNARMS